MERISLIVPLASGSAFSAADVEAYRRVLQEQGGSPAVEVILAGGLAEPGEPVQARSPTRVVTTGAGRVGSVRAGLEVASGEYLVVLDPERSYPPQALIQVIEPLRSREADLAIAVPRRFGTGSGRRSPWRAGLGLVSQLALGTSDVFSGLVAIRRDQIDRVPPAQEARGSRLVLDFLAWRSGRQRDVPVALGQDDRCRLGPFGLDDVRQLKRVLDHRFGNFSRLVQFCMVGASGMVVDLTIYALLQLLFARIWSLPAGRAGVGFSWPLAVAGALAILVALVWNFTLNRRLTFNDARKGSLLRQFVTYALGNALGIGVSLSLRLSLPAQFAVFARHKLAAAAVGIVVATGISFSMSRWVVFIRRPDARRTPGRPHLTVDAALQEPAAVS